MVTVVLLTTLITPLIMRGAFMIKCPQDVEEEDESSSGGSAEYTEVAEMRAEA
jgi:hypothetical protein